MAHLYSGHSFSESNSVKGSFSRTAEAKPASTVFLRSRNPTGCWIHIVIA